MVGIASTVLTVVFIVATSLSLFYILYLLSKEKGLLHGVLGFLFPIYPYIWGWVNGARLQIFDIMAFWTFVSIGAFVFPMVMGFVSAPMMVQPSVQSVSTGEDVTRRGPISPGGQAQGELEGLFDIDEYTLAGEAGDRVTIRCRPAPGSETDPRVTVLGPNGNEVVSDDDGGDGMEALISDFALPESGTYRIQVDVWSPGPYVLTVD